MAAGTEGQLPQWEQDRRDALEDQVLLLEQLGSGASARVNTLFYYLLEFGRGLILPKLNGYELMQVKVYLLHIVGSHFAMVMFAKILMVKYGSVNTLLLMSLGSLVPFLIAFRSLLMYIPCPQMAAVVSNSAIFVILIILFGLTVGMYGSTWTSFVFIFQIWPLLPIGSMVARQYITRDKSVNQFSPVTRLPFIAFVGVAGNCFMMLSLKCVTLTDYLVLATSDGILAALIAPVFFGVDRLKIHFLFIKYYIFQCVLIGMYFGGEQRAPPNPEDTNCPTEAFNVYHGYVLISRMFCVTRSIYIKQNFAAFNSAEKVKDHPETYDGMFQAMEQPRKHRFARFPGPVLFTLDAVFDSGLVDTELHGVGPLGTHDLFLLTDFTYMLPAVSLASMVIEGGDGTPARPNTLQYGFLPPMHSKVADIRDADFDEGYAPVVTTEDTIWMTVLILLFCLAYALQPWATAKYLFSRGSSTHVWKNRPLVLSFIPFFIDVLILNVRITKFQIIFALMNAGVELELRAGLWNRFKRKYLVLLTKELHYHMPSSLRGLQKRTLVEFLQQTSTDDYLMLLLETCIHHGNNIRQFSRDTGIAVWDPRPSATAAWKLATSIVMKALKHEKAAKKEQKGSKTAVMKFIRELVLECARNAVEYADGHGQRMKLADIHARQRDKLRAIKKLRKLVVERRLRRHAKQTYLSCAPVILASTGGALRAVDT
jgi:hypothetical protein